MQAWIPVVSSSLYFWKSVFSFRADNILKSDGDFISWRRAFLWCMSPTSHDRDNSHRVRTHEKSSGETVCRLGTIIQRLFLCPIRRRHPLEFLEIIQWELVPRGSFARTWKLSSRLFSQPDWLPLGLRGWLVHCLVSKKVSVKHWSISQSIRLATSRPLGEQSEPCLAAKRPIVSDEVTRGRLVSFDGFPFVFRAKKGELRDLHLGFQVSFASPWLQWQNVLIPLRLNLLNVCVYLHHRRSKIFYSVQKLTTSGDQKKSKACFNLESILGKEISNPKNPWHPHTF